MRILSFAFLFICAATAIAAQTIDGMVIDSKGAAISGADVRLFVNNVERSRTFTDTEGRFSINGAIEGRLVVNAIGFALFVRELDPGGSLSLRIVLQPTAISADVSIHITRTETRLSETPASVVVLTREALDSTAAQAIDDALRQIAGFTLFRRGSSKTANPTTHGANLRGISGSGASRTAVLFDGLSLNDAFGGWTYWSRVPQIAVEQAEVLRGGASALYGSGGLSGAVNLVPIRPTDNDRFIRIRSSAGTQQTFDGGVLAAFSKSGWAFDVASEVFRTDGYVPVANSERGSIDSNANSKHWNMLAGSERRFGYFPQGPGSNERRIHGRLFARANLFSEDRDNGTSLTNNASYFRQASAGFDLSNERIGRIEFRSFLQAQVYDQTFSAVSADRNSETLTRLQRVPSQAAGGHLLWTRPFGDHTFVSSLEARDVRGFSDEIGFLSGQPTSASGSGGRERTVAFYGQDLWRANERVSIGFSGRFDRWRNADAHSVTRSLANNSVVLTLFPDRTEWAFSPRIATLASITRSISAYGSYSHSFRAPTLNELYRGFRVGNVLTQANDELRSETARTFEGGASYISESRRVSVRGIFFTTFVRDPIVSITLSSTPNLITRQRKNVGQTFSKGLEIDAEFVPRSELRVSTSLIVVDSRISKFPADTSLQGNRLPQVARKQITLLGNYSPASWITIGFQGRASSAQFEDDLNTLRLRPYFTMDAIAVFRVRKGLEVYSAAENVFNSRYDIGLTPNRTVASPISFRTGLRYRFTRK